MQRLTLILIQTVAVICLAQAGWLYAATMASADASGGYAARVLEKVLTVWAPPPALKSNFEVRVMVSIDGNGNLQECKPIRKSGLEALDTSACGSVKQVTPFASPPDGRPVEVYLVFWTGKPKGKFREQPPTQEEVIRAEIMARAKAERLIGKESASSAEIAARQRAEAVAIKTGRQLPEIGDTPVAPPARADKQLRVVPRKKDAASEGKEKSSRQMPVTANESSVTELKAPDKSEQVQNDPGSTPLSGQTTSGKNNVLPRADTRSQPAPKNSSISQANNVDADKHASGKNDKVSGENFSGKSVASETFRTSQKHEGPADVALKSEPPKSQGQEQAPDPGLPMLLAKSSDLPEINDSAYIRKIRWQIIKSTYVPARAKPGEYNATVRILLDGQGNIRDSAMLNGSGSTFVDSYIMRGISRRSKVTPPPGGEPSICTIKIRLVRKIEEDRENTDQGKKSAPVSEKAGTGQTDPNSVNAPKNQKAGNAKQESTRPASGE